MSEEHNQNQEEEDEFGSEIQIKPKYMFFDYTNKKFDEKDSNFIKYINDSARTLDEFVGYVGDHIEAFMDIIETFKRLIKQNVNDDDEGIISMRERIKELKGTIESLEFVLEDLKTNPLGKKIESQPE